MVSILVALVSFLAISETSEWKCDKQKAIAEFKKKIDANPWPRFENNPYNNQTKESNKKIEDYLKDNESVCALRYTDESKKVYTLADFPNLNQATEAGYAVTHQGRCSACSNLQDLAVYLEKNLTQPVRSCGTHLLNYRIDSCLTGLGFSPSCVDIWKFNIINTRKKCLIVCLKSKIINEPFNKPDGSLNDCLQCDEDKSGPVFKYFAGRTRRNSGIVSEIERPGEQVYEMDHCYF